MKIVSNTKNQTSKLAKELAGKILRLRLGQGAVVVGLSGELGSGKTAFCQSFAKALGVKEKIHSPTFVIFRRYGNLYHFDAYRIKNKKDIISLGWKKIISDPQNIILVEWAENIKKVFPKKHFWIKMAHLGKNKRGIDIKSVK
jgi:tRNA threonylcarbamoyladenosine biosynthesis protein TsaE